MNPEEKNISDDCLQKAMILIDSMQHPLPPDEAADCKEEIFDRVTRKISSGTTLRPVKSNNRRRFLRYPSIAAAVILLLISIGGIGYFLGYNTRSGELTESFIHVDALEGTLTHITLNDGTKVILNGGSTLSYPAVFRNERHITLSGEAFFDVARDEKPFIVNSRNLSVKVLGTRFDFKAYEEDAQTFLTLQEGSVNALPKGEFIKEGIILKPDQQLVLDNETGEFQCRNVQAAEYISWKDGVMTFRDQTLSEIATILQRKFNLKINIINDPIQSERYSAQFKYGENVEQILEKLSYKRNWTYQKTKDYIEITTR